MFITWLVVSAALSFIFGAWLIQPVLGLLRRGGLVRENYRRQEIPTGSGLVLPLAVTPSALLSLAVASSGALIRSLSAELILLNGMALLGLLDDSAGQGTTRGLVGHLRRLWHGELTTGAVKALYGICIAFLSASLIPDKSLLERTVSTAVIALSANAVNLFDLRPGRALKAFFLAYAIIAFLTGSAGLLTMSVAAAALSLVSVDLAGEAMLGDTGANVLGSSLGFFIVSQASRGGEITALSLLTALHVYAEFSSINSLIERVSFLNWLDSLGR
ncbi:MAG: glycosyl transferase [Firmicutes bacterium]|nr:glycosyl transferase [Bacillota bacterium]